MKWFRIILILFLVAITALTSAIVLYLGSAIPARQATEVTIRSRSSIAGVIDSLSTANAVKYPLLFGLCAKAYSIINSQPLISGTYRFQPGTSHGVVLKSLFTGKQVVTVNLTFREGIGIRDFASVVGKGLKADSTEFVELAESDSLCKARLIPGTNVEGYLMPDTYNFYWNQKPADIIDRLLDAQDKIWKDRFQAQAATQRRSRHEVLTLASIVEAEAADPAERPRIAGVYANRLKKGMKLDADPTVQYAIRSQRRLLLSDLEVDDAYNTYRNKGLPPGPINSPGAASIAAALNPEEHNFLFFVSKGDGSGQHNFAATLKEHNRNVALYRQRRRTQSIGN